MKAGLNLSMVPGLEFSTPTIGLEGSLSGIPFDRTETSSVSGTDSQLKLLFGPFGSVLKRLNPAKYNHTLTGWSSAFLDKEGLDALAKVTDDYVGQLQARDYAVTPSFGLDHERLKQKGLEQHVEEFNRKAVDIVVKSVQASGKSLSIASYVAPVGDTHQPYDPDSRLQFPKTTGGELDIDAAANYHARQINALLSVKDNLGMSYVKTFFFETNATVEQPIAAAIAGERSKTSYIISFVVDNDGYLIGTTDVDGNPVGPRGKVTLAEAIKEVSRYTGSGLVTYGINCSSYDGAKKALGELRRVSITDESLKNKIGILYLNASDHDPRVHDKHDAKGHLDKHENVEPKEFARRIVELGREYGIKTLGVCCGGDAAYLAEIRKAYNNLAAGSSAKATVAAIKHDAQVPVGAF